MPSRHRLGAIGALALGLGAMVAVPSGVAAKGSPKPHVCKGTLKAPGVVSGTYKSGLVIHGACNVNHGLAHVFHTLQLSSGSMLNATFGKKHSKLVVTGNVVVGRRATLLLGCGGADSTCTDEPNQKAPTLKSHARITGNLIATNALGVLVHNVTVGGSVTQIAGGGGFTCIPPSKGAFSVLQSPFFSVYEDSTIGRNVEIAGLKSCWLGVIRNKIGGKVKILKNKLADDDAIEIETNKIGKNLTCRRNSAVWDNSETSSTGALFPRTPPSRNKVKGKRFGQCVLSSPMTPGAPKGPGPF